MPCRTNKLASDHQSAVPASWILTNGVLCEEQIRYLLTVGEPPGTVKRCWKEEDQAQAIPVATDCKWAWGIMGQELSNKQTGIYECMRVLLERHKKTLPKQEFRIRLKWMSVKFPEVTPVSIFMVQLWDMVRVKLYDLITRRDEQALKMLPAMCEILEAMKAQEQIQKAPTSLLDSESEEGWEPPHDRPQPSALPRPYRLPVPLASLLLVNQSKHDYLVYILVTPWALGRSKLFSAVASSGYCNYPFWSKFL